ncbi:MAG: iron ABC transporter permease, partial [Pyramidobacter sp.]|nr:iron ABC transporter permease [Pyramidobacter sp.]
MFGRKRSDLDRMEGRRFGFDQFSTTLCFVLLIIIAVAPVAMIVYNAFWDSATGQFDVSLFSSVLFDAKNVRAMKNSLIVTFYTTLIATTVGTFFAWLMARSDLPCKRIMNWMFTIPFMIPPFLGAMAWDMLLSPRGGYINRWLMQLLGLRRSPFNINTVWGIVFVEVIYFFSFVYNQVAAALERMDPTLEESARIAGAGQLYVIRHITLPLVIPAISSGSVLVLITSIANYGIAATLGFSGGVYTLPTKIVEIMEAANGSFIGIRKASIVSILLVVVVAIALILQRRLMNVGHYDIIKGKSMRPTLMKLRKAKWPLLSVSLFFLALAVVSPMIIIVIVSFLKAFGMNIFSWSSYTLNNYKDILINNSAVYGAMNNTLFLSFAAGLVDLFLGVMLSFVIYKVKPKGRGFLEFLAVLPYSRPGTVLSVGCILAWSGQLGVNLYNTLWILLIAYCARFLSYTLKSCSASLQQVHPSLEEASRTCGATRMDSLIDVTIPLIKPAMLSSFFLVFLPSMRELTTSVLLVGPRTRTLGVIIDTTRAGGYMSRAAALGVVTVVMIMIVNGIVTFLLRDRKGLYAM